jgi:hypothetical protein
MRLYGPNMHKKNSDLRKGRAKVGITRVSTREIGQIRTLPIKAWTLTNNLSRPCSNIAYRIDGLCR